MDPFSIVTSVRSTSATRRSRTLFAAVSTALRAAASHDSLLTPITSVTRYTPSAMHTSLVLWLERAGPYPFPVADCDHLDQVEFLEPEGEVAGCEECLKTGGRWVHLR